MTSGLLPLAYGTNFGRAVPHWKMREITWGKFCRLLQTPAAAKEEAMSYVLGTIAPGPGNKCKCKEFLHRTKATVVNRSAITLDADYCGNAGSALVGSLKRLGVAAAAHTTWSSEKNDERYRIIIPMNRLAGPMEYAPIARWFMRELGDGFFDHTCDQASRLMYLPAAPDGGDRYWLGVMDGDWMDVDLWLDLAGGPDVVEDKVRPEPTPKVEMPFEQYVQLRGLFNKVRTCQEGNRDALLLWALKAVLDDGIDPEVAGPVLAEAGIEAGLDEDVVWEKVARILG